MAALAKWRDLNNASITTTGTANAQAFLSGIGYTVVPSGLRVTLKAVFTNTDTMTLNMDGIGGVTVKNRIGNALTGGEFVVNAPADLIYNGTNWILLSAASSTVSQSPELPPDKLPGGGLVGSGVYDTPTGALYLVIEAVGGGAGGASSNSAGSIGEDGGDTIIQETSGSLRQIIAHGGKAGTNAAGGLGGTATGGDFIQDGQPGGNPTTVGAGTGGDSYFGGGGVNGAGATAYGGGGAGGTMPGLFGGGGGGAGYARLQLNNPAPHLSYSVDPGGDGGPAGEGPAGGRGASGIILITAYFQ